MHSGKMGETLIEKERQKMESIPAFTPRKIGFISSSGFEETSPDALFITGKDIYSA